MTFVGDVSPKYSTNAEHRSKVALYNVFICVGCVI